MGSVGGPELRALEHLAAVSSKLGAAVASDHACYVRAEGLESGHLLPMPFSEEGLAVLVENVQLAQRTVPVPFAVENIAALVKWPGATWSEGEFLRRLVEATGCGLVLDLANLHANAINFGGPPIDVLRALPLERVAYVHVAGGVRRERRYHDTHAHPLPDEVVALVRTLRALGCEAGVLLERDDRFPPPEALDAELATLTAALAEPVAAAPPPLAPLAPARAAMADSGSPSTQGALLRALVADGPVPHGFDADDVETLAHALSHKRSRVAATAWPRLAACLGVRFERMFIEYVAPTPQRPTHAGLVDGLTLAQWAEAQGVLDVAATEELAAVRLLWVPTVEGIVPRSRLLAWALARGRTSTTRALRVFGHVWRHRQHHDARS